MRDRNGYTFRMNKYYLIDFVENIQDTVKDYWKISHLGEYAKKYSIYQLLERTFIR